MISRVAECCFWAFRYIERFQNTARLLEVNLGFVLDAELPLEHCWRPLVIVSGERERFDDLLGASASEDAEAVQDYLVWDERNPTSVINSLKMARENVRRIREVTSEEMWGSLNGFWHWMRGGAGRRLYRSAPDRFYARVRDWPLEFFGITLETTLHEEPFDFMRLGVFLERAGQTARILDVKYHMVGPTTDRVPTAVEHASWLALLKSCSAFEPFFKRHNTLPVGPDVAGFLIFEQSFPRSVRFCADRARNYLNRIRTRSDAFGQDAEAQVATTREKLEQGSIDAFIEAGLHHELTDLVGRFAGICDAVQREYFAPPDLGVRKGPHVPPAQTQREVADVRSAQTAERRVSPAPSGEAHAGAAPPPVAPEQPPIPRTLVVEHDTTYAYETPVESSHHVLRLHPVHDQFQEVVEHSIEIIPFGGQSTFEDVFGNRALRLQLDQPYSELHVRMRSVVRIHWPELLNLPHERRFMPLTWMPWQRQMMHAYLLPPELPESQLRAISDYAEGFAERNEYDVIDTLNDINNSIRRDYAYVSGSTTNETTPFEVYATRQGVCQDFANLFICMARLLGIPARYRVGYIFTGSGYENRIQSDATHAWAETYLPHIGWRGFDPTNGLLAGWDHIRVAAGRNFRDATPTSGTIFRGGLGEVLTIRVEVRDGAAVGS